MGVKSFLLESKNKINEFFFYVRERENSLRRIPRIVTATR